MKGCCEGLGGCGIGKDCGAVKGCVRGLRGRDGFVWRIAEGPGLLWRVVGCGGRGELVP